MVILLSATIDEVDRPLIEAIAEHVRQISGGSAALTIKRVEPGSVKLTLEGSQDDLERIKALFESGQLNEVLGIPVQDVQILSSELKNSNPLNDLFSKAYILLDIVVKGIKQKGTTELNSEMKIHARCKKRQSEQSETIFTVTLNSLSSFNFSPLDLMSYLKWRETQDSEEGETPIKGLEESILQIVQQTGDGEVVLGFSRTASGGVDFTCSVTILSRHDILQSRQKQLSFQDNSSSADQNKSNLFEQNSLEIRRSIRRLNTVVNVLEETVNVLEEALEESPRLREFISEPEQWLQLWADHINSFRTTIRGYNDIFKQSSTTSQQFHLILNSIRSYSIQVTQYVQLVQEYCTYLLSESGENRFSQIEERINHLNESLNNSRELVDISLVRESLLAFNSFVIAIDDLLNNESMKIQENSIRLGEEGLNNYHQLVALLRTDIATWENRISLYEDALNDVSFSADYLLEAREEIREFLADLSNYTRLVQEIYRNLLEL